MNKELNSSTQIDEGSSDGKRNYFFLSSPTLLENERYIDEKLREIKTAPALNVRNQAENHQARFIKHLENEVYFLREELQNKNRIIEVLLNDVKTLDSVNNKLRNFTNIPSQKLSTNFNNVFTDKNDQAFKIPKRTSKQKDPLVNTSEIKLNNRYSLLNHNEIDVINDDNDCTLNDNIEHISTQKYVNNITSRKKKSKRPKQIKKVVTILGDSIIKEIQGHNLTSDEHKVIVKPFLGARTSCMHHHVQPTLKQNPDVIILHCGTNDLKSEKDSEQIATEIIDLALHITSNHDTSLMISSLVVRGDKFHDKATQVNEFLSKKCGERNMGFINNDNLTKSHLNRSRLHLNRKGSQLLERNFKEVISN